CCLTVARDMRSSLAISRSRRWPCFLRHCKVSVIALRPRKEKRRHKRQRFLILGVPTGIRTPVIAVKGRCPRPLDDGDKRSRKLEGFRLGVARNRVWWR